MTRAKSYYLGGLPATVIKETNKYLLLKSRYDIDGKQILNHHITDKTGKVILGNRTAEEAQKEFDIVTRYGYPSKEWNDYWTERNLSFKK